MTQPTEICLVPLAIHTKCGLAVKSTLGNEF